MKKLYFITSNRGKFIEAKQKIEPLGIKLFQKNLGYPEIQVDTLEEVVQYGIQYLEKIFPHSFIIEDAGLFINKLNGFPGVYSSYVYHTIGCQGILKLLDKTGMERRTAVFRSVYGYKEPGKKSMLFKGEIYGKISISEKGKNGFGYDPIFIPDKATKTFAQMTLDEKNTWSHRGKALEKLVGFLSKKID